MTEPEKMLEANRRLQAELAEAKAELQEHVRRIEVHMAEARTDGTVRVVILTGAGDRAFCAGADLDGMVGADTLELHRSRPADRRRQQGVGIPPRPQREFVVTGGRLAHLHVPGLEQGDVAAGELLTLSALLEPYKVTTTARAEEPSRLISIDAAGLRAMCEVDARLGYTLMRHLAQAIKERLDYTRVQLAAARPS